MLNLFLAVVRRDLMLALRQKTDIVQTLFFFAVVITLVPLGVGAEQNLLRSMAPGVVWVRRFWRPSCRCRASLPLTTPTGRSSRCSSRLSP